MEKMEGIEYLESVKSPEEINHRMKGIEYLESVKSPEDINWNNYIDGSVKDYELAFQEQEWYDKNKNNFCDSLLNKYPEELPEFIHDVPIDNIPGNYLGFSPDDLIRFGELDQTKVFINDQEIMFWVVKMPVGLQMYHSSRPLGLNHAVYPVRNYDERMTKEENKKVTSNHCKQEDFIGHHVSDIMDAKVCTYISYYSTPSQTKEYLKSQNKSSLYDSTAYAYGVGKSSDEMENPDLNDRLDIQSNEQLYGVQAYTLT